MFTIVDIDSSSVLLEDESIGFRGRYSNTASDRTAVQSLLTSNQDIWHQILSKWTIEPTVVPDNDLLEFEQLRLQKQSIIKEWCHQKIVNGISIDLGLTGEDGAPLGELHYSLTEQHQSDMRDLASMISNGATQVTWRDDSRVSHMVYTSTQFMTLYQAASVHILQCRFRSDGLEELLFTYSSDQRELINSLTWETELPVDIEEKMQSLLNTMLAANSSM